MTAYLINLTLAYIITGSFPLDTTVPWRWRHKQTTPYMEVTHRQTWTFSADGQKATLVWEKHIQLRQKSAQCLNSQITEKNRYVFSVRRSGRSTFALKLLKKNEKQSATCDAARSPEIKGATLTVYESHAVIDIVGIKAAIYPVRAGGVWVWENFSVLESSDIKTEKEVWVLHTDSDGTVTGWYDRYVKRVSGDGNSFRCNGRMTVTLITRYTVKGHVKSSGMIELRETSYELTENDPCEPSRVRTLSAYRGIIEGNRMFLSTDSGETVLTLRNRLSPTKRSHK